MIERFAILLAVGGAVFVAGTLMKTSARRRRRAAMETVEFVSDALGQPRIVSFFGPSCDACDRQKLVLSELEFERSGRLRVEHHDAALEYDYARQFGLTIVPTTVVIGPSGAIAGINSGFTSRVVLEAQLDAA